MFASEEASVGNTNGDSSRRPGRRKSVDSLLRKEKQDVSERDEKIIGRDGNATSVDMKDEEGAGKDEKAKENTPPPVSFFKMFR